MYGDFRIVCSSLDDDNDCVDIIADALLRALDAQAVEDLYYFHQVVGNDTRIRVPSLCTPRGH